MASKGNRLYQCDECKERSFHHWIEKNRASRMRCPRCGSARLELVTKEAKDEEVAMQRVRLEGHRDMTIPKGNVHKKVT